MDSDKKYYEYDVGHGTDVAYIHVPQNVYIVCIIAVYIYLDCVLEEEDRHKCHTPDRTHGDMLQYCVWYAPHQLDDIHMNILNYSYADVSNVLC